MPFVARPPVSDCRRGPSPSMTGSSCQVASARHAIQPESGSSNRYSGAEAVGGIGELEPGASNMCVHSQAAMVSRPKSQQNSNMANMSRIHGIPLPEDLPFNWLAGWLAAWTNLSLTGLGALNEIHFLPLGFALFSPLLAHIFLHLTFQQFFPFSPHQAPRCVINFESTHTCSRTSFPVFATVRDSRSCRLLAPDGS